MKIQAVYLRFFRSFNIDYVRKAHPRVKENPWDDLDGTFQPYVKVPLEPTITALVGANESGKSQFLAAVKCLTGNLPVSRADFCRHSEWFAVGEGEQRTPDLGVEFAPFDEATLAEHAELSESLHIGTTLLAFSVNSTAPTWYARDGIGEAREVDLPKGLLAQLLPQVVNIDEDVALPASIPLSLLGSKPETGLIRAAVRRIADRAVRAAPADWMTNAETGKVLAQAIVDGVRDESRIASAGLSESHQLAKTLLREVAGIAPKAFDDLEAAMLAGNEGYASSVTQRMNRRLEERLNFPSTWGQDNQFQLIVAARESDLVFTIRDRTGTDYSFQERSHGLRYFLSYYVQFLAAQRTAKRAIVVMDEPDAYLSSQGQQDLLKVFQRFVEKSESQLVYVTHSPFLIDRNHAERIKVLDKGAKDEGTRVVRNAARNHYEPLRTAIGVSIGESAFIGNHNLFVEGPADQILLTGVSGQLRRTGTPQSELLDLNEVTIVPAGSARHVPYLVFLARGRDTDQPSAVVLLDGDSEGDAAVEQLRAGTPRGRKLIPAESVLQFGTGALDGQPGGWVEMEDLVSVDVAVNAAGRYITNFIGAESGEEAKLEAAAIESRLRSGLGLFDAIEAEVAEICPESHVDKVGFARCVLEVIADSPVESWQIVADNFTRLFRVLNVALRAAGRARTGDRISARVERTVGRFLADHLASAKRDEARMLFDEVLAVLDESADADLVRTRVHELRRDHRLDEEIGASIEEFGKFRSELESLKYQPLIASQREEPTPRATAPTRQRKAPAKQTRPPRSQAEEVATENSANDS